MTSAAPPWSLVDFYRKGTPILAPHEQRDVPAPKVDFSLLEDDAVSTPVASDLGEVTHSGHGLPVTSDDFPEDAVMSQQLALSLVNEVDIDARFLNEEGWKYHQTPSQGEHRLILIPAMDANERLLAVRALDARPGAVPRLGSSGDPEVAMFRLRHEVEADPDAGLAVEDVPTPFRVGLFDGPLTWVSHDPVDALALRFAGVNATSMARPRETLGSAEGLLQLQDLGALDARRSPRGILVIVDPGDRLSPSQGGLLAGLFQEVWELPNSTGLDYVGRWLASKREGTLGNPTKRALSHIRDHQSRWRCWYPAIPLPPRWAGAGWALPLEPLESVSVEEMRKAAAKEVDWLVKGFVAPNSITELQGIPKDGKSTFALPMMAALSQGDEFLGHRCKETAVLYVTEQMRGSAFRSLERGMPKEQDVPPLPKLHFITVETLYGRSWAQVVAFVRKECKRLKARVVVFDTLSQVAGLHGEAEHSSGTARELFRSLRALNFDGIAVVAVRHSRKAGGRIAETGLGSIATSGEADHIVRIRKVKGRERVRRIETVGRIGDSADMLVELTGDGWARLPEVPVDDSGPERRHQVESFVLDQVGKSKSGPLSRQDLRSQGRDRKDGPISESSLDQACRALCGRKLLEKVELGGQGNPVGYRLPGRLEEDGSQVEGAAADD